MADITTLVDDIDGSFEGVTRVQFSYDGQAYEIDLSSANRQRFEKFIDGYADKAREVVGKGKPVKQHNDNAAVRVWARSQGIKLGDRGRIEKSITEAYRAAMAK